MKGRPKPIPSTPLQLTRKALRDLREIETYSVEHWGRATADEYLDLIEAALDRITQDPTILGAPSDAHPGLHFYRVKRHCLICDWDRSSVIVLAVLHTSMDIPSRLMELEPNLTAEIELLRSRLPRSSGS